MITVSRVLSLASVGLVVFFTTSLASLGSTMATNDFFLNIPPRLQWGNNAGYCGTLIGLVLYFFSSDLICFVVLLIILSQEKSH